MNADTLYCLCRKPYEDNQFMIECDVCKEWFHGKCVNLKEESAEDIEFYHCPTCQIMHGPVVYKKRKMHQRNNSKFLDNSESKTGSLKFLMELKQRIFPSADTIPLMKTSSYNLTKEFFEKCAFDLPILIHDKGALGLKLPPPSFTVHHIENFIGGDKVIDVIDVANQKNCQMTMSQWSNYYYNKHLRTKIYNVISLEFSNTRLADVVSPPSIIHDISWVDKYWPKHHPSCSQYPPKPFIQRYCLMGVQDSFTDFHVDFGGTCVWYHIFEGEKIFYLIKPTAANLVLYERWLSSSNQFETFFADQVDTCYMASIKQGETILIPTGWIHAVFTPVDSIVFGGNFLTDHNVATQLKVYEIERRVRTEHRFMYPSFESMHWYAAVHFHGLLSDLNDRCMEVDERLAVGIKALITALKSWSSPRDTSGTHDDVPSCKCTPINPTFLLRDLHKLLKTTAPFLNKLTKGAKDYTKKSTSDHYKVNYRANNSSLRLRVNTSHLNSSSLHKTERYEDDDEDEDDGHLVVDERARAYSKNNSYHHQNPSISHLLHASGYDSKGDNMRDAIQGMLTMSQMDPSNYQNKKYSQKQKYYSDDIEEELNSCYKDDNFVYPSVASSDSDDGKVGKKEPKDEAWNPKGASRHSRKSLSTRSSRTNGLNRRGEADHSAKKEFASNENTSDAFDYNDTHQDRQQLSYQQALLQTIHDMHNYSNTSFYYNKPSEHQDADDDDDDYDEEDDDDVEIIPKKKQINFIPQKKVRSKKTPSTARQRLAHKLKLNRDCY